MGHSVLIVDDDTGTRTLVSRALDARGYATFTAENGAEGVRKLAELKPCVIVLDFEMPVMDGHDFHEVHKVIAPDVPIICITGSPEGTLVARRVGAASAHLKPFDIEALSQSVADLCSLPHTHRHTAAVEASIELDRNARRDTEDLPSSL